MNYALYSFIRNVKCPKYMNEVFITTILYYSKIHSFMISFSHQVFYLNVCIVYCYSWTCFFKTRLHNFPFRGLSAITAHHTKPLPLDNVSVYLICASRWQKCYPFFSSLERRNPNLYEEQEQSLWHCEIPAISYPGSSLVDISYHCLEC